MTNILLMAFTPSSFDRIWFTTDDRVASPLSSDDDRFRNTASISSITITCKALFVASLLQAANSASASANNCRTNFSLPPTQRSNNSGAETIFGVRARNAREISRASAVLPIQSKK